MRLSTRILLTTALTGSLVVAGTSRAEQVEAQHVLDSLASYQVGVLDLGPGLPPIPDLRVIEDGKTFRALGITNSGDVLLTGKFDQTANGGRADFYMYSLAGQHDGAPNFTIAPTNGFSSPVDGTTVSIEANTAAFLLPDAAGFTSTLTPTGLVFPDKITRFEQYKNLNSASPSYNVLGTVNLGTAQVDFPFDFPATDTAPGSAAVMIGSNKAGSEFYYGAQKPGASRAIYRVVGTDSTATVEELISENQTITLDGNPFTTGLLTGAAGPAIINEGGFHGAYTSDAAGNDMLVGYNESTGNFTQLAIRGQAVPGRDGYTIGRISQARSASMRTLDSSADGLVAFDAHIYRPNTSGNTSRLTGSLFVGDTKTGTLRYVQSAPVVNLSNAAFEAVTSLTPRFDVDGGLITYGFAFTSEDDFTTGLFRYQLTSNTAEIIVGDGQSIGTTDFTINDVNDFNFFGINAFMPHESGALVLVSRVTNADGSLDGDALLVRDTDGTLRPVILPGDTVSLADGTLIAVDEILAFERASGLSSSNQLINDDGLMALTLLDANGAGGVFVVDLGLTPVPEPTTAMFMVSGLTLLARRRRRI